MDTKHIAFSFIVWCLCGIPTATGEAECAEQRFCCGNEDCLDGIRCINKTCLNTDPCEANWIYSKGSCYFFSTEEKVWDEANETCSQYATPGLVEVDSVDEDNFIKKQLQGAWDYNDANGSLSTLFWIGGTYWQSLGNYAWSNGRRITDFYWSPSRPANGPKGCLGYFTGFSGWIDLLCHNNHRYICEKPVETEDACGCLPIYLPVCGSDGQDYVNKCEAYRANVPSAEGKCWF